MQLIFTLILVFLGSFFPEEVLAQAIDTVPATVKIGVCGDGVAEGREECDNEDLKSQTCYSIGFGGGTVVCDPSCTLDTTLCIPRPPTRIVDHDDSDDDDNVVTRTVRVVVSPIINIINVLSNPDFLKKFDTNLDGKITYDELFASAQTWFDAWMAFRKNALTATYGTEVTTCDLNDDGVCDLIDFSILMYYINA